jgi:putative membrane protein
MDEWWRVVAALGGTLMLRPYVVAFLAAFIVIGGRDQGIPRTLVHLVWGALVAFTAEFASTRTGIPFGQYHYTATTAGRELFIADVPIFDPLSFPFLAYASWCLARWGAGRERGLRPVVLAGLLMLLLDVVLDPLAVRGDRWFLGRVFYYPGGGSYFGVPLVNFAGWAVVGWVLAGGHALLSRGGQPGVPLSGVCFYYGILAFGLGMTIWIGEFALAGMGILLHTLVFLVLWTGLAGAQARSAKTTFTYEGIS